MPATDLLKQALSKLEKLPPKVQDAIAARWLEELKDERSWTAKFAATTDEQWDRLAASVRDEIAAGDTTSLDAFLEELMVLELYRRGTISSGKAAELLGMPRWKFVRYASRLGIAFFDMTKGEWEAEVQQAETL